MKQLLQLNQADRPVLYPGLTFINCVSSSHTLSEVFVLIGSVTILQILETIQFLIFFVSSFGTDGQAIFKFV